MFDKTAHAFKNFYRLFTSDLTRAEIERLVKVDTRGMYAFYFRHTQKPALEKKPWKRALIFIRELFVTFLLKLTPARRLLYALAVLLFALALLDRNWWHGVYAFVILNFLLALELADKLIAKDELAVAREIQLSLLPNQSLALLRLYPNGEIELCRAGHTPALFYDNAKSYCLWLEPKGIAIGLENSDGFRRKLELSKQPLQAGDVLLLFTDGVIETANGQLLEFGENRLAQILSRNPQAPPEQIKSILLQELHSFRSGAELRDDTTFVVIKRSS